MLSFGTSASASTNNSATVDRFTLLLYLLSLIGNVLMPVAMGISALVVRAKYMESNVADACVTSSAVGIQFHYTTWLLVYGIVSIVFPIVGLLVMTTLSTHNGVVGRIYSVLGGLFLIAWYVIGVILFFIEVQPSCPLGGMIASLGWSIFIVESCVVAVALLRSCC